MYKCICLFASSREQPHWSTKYICEQTFSIMKYVQSKLTSSLTDVNLVLRLFRIHTSEKKLHLKCLATTNQIHPLSLNIYVVVFWVRGEGFGQILSNNNQISVTTFGSYYIKKTKIFIFSLDPIVHAKFWRL